MGFGSLVLVFVLAGAESPAHASSGQPCSPAVNKPCLSKNEAIELQMNYVRSHNVDLGTFIGPTVFHKCYVQGCYRGFFYDGAERTPGNHFMIIVDDPAGTVEWVGGL